MKYRDKDNGIILNLDDGVLHINTISLNNDVIKFNLMTFILNDSDIKEVLELLLIRYKNNNTIFYSIILNMLNDINTGNI